jgi:ribosome-binding ATPase YchF (GTP1/OBG family)
MPGLTIPVRTRAVEAAGAIHSDLENTSSALKPSAGTSFEAGSEANARAKGTLRLEGKDYIVQDGDVMHIRHSGIPVLKLRTGTHKRELITNQFSVLGF